MNLKVVKFGGSSLSDADHFKQVREIVKKEEARRYIIVSAPGKRNANDQKVTDLLYLCYDLAKKSMPFDCYFRIIEDRFQKIKMDLDLTVNIQSELEIVRRGIIGTESKEWCASRGEFLCGLLLADYLGWKFIDAAEIICFHNDGELDEEKTNNRISETLADTFSAVIPGFYGTTEAHEVLTFPRGGSDITGSLVARGVKADVYENWTDVSGFLMADPQIVEQPKEIPSLSYMELRELSHMGASVLQEEAVIPVCNAHIPINIRNTNRPDHPGTYIYNADIIEKNESIISGITGQGGYVYINIQKDILKNDPRFEEKVLKAVLEEGIIYDYMTIAIDSICIVVRKERQKEDVFQTIESLEKRIGIKNCVSIEDEMAIVAVVGRGLINNYGMLARIFSSIGNQKIKIKLTSQVSKGLNVIVGVKEKDYRQAIRAIYKEFILQNNKGEK